jgi:hypothetical protein
MISPAAFTVTDSCADAICAGDPASVTETVNVELPLAVGVPEITPALDSVSPAGRLPDAMDHVYPGVPPVTLSAFAYDAPTCAAGSEPDPMLSVGITGRTTIENVTVWLCAGELESETLKLKLDVPLAVGVPEITPALESVNPAGRLPDATDHVYPGVPPDAESVEL